MNVFPWLFIAPFCQDVKYRGAEYDKITHFVTTLLNMIPLFFIIYVNIKQSNPKKRYNAFIYIPTPKTFALYGSYLPVK